MRQIRVQDATNRFIRHRLAISLRQEVPFGQRCQSYISRRPRTPDSVGCIHFGNPTPMRLFLRKELLASSPISVFTVMRFFITPYPINSTTPRARPFLVPRYQLKNTAVPRHVRTDDTGNSCRDFDCCSLFHLGFLLAIHYRIRLTNAVSNLFGSTPYFSATSRR